jgi:hypothetical protein
VGHPASGTQIRLIHGKNKTSRLGHPAFLIMSAQMTDVRNPAPVSTPHTRAWLAFEQNIETISQMVDLGGREIFLLNAEAARVTAFVRKKLGDVGTKPNKKASAAAVRSVQKFFKTIQARIGRHLTVNLWQVVMLVTCVEAYLQDLLSAAASVGPELMTESEPASYADVIAATSLTELANKLCARWARGWLKQRGPTRWISSFKKMGAKGYPTDLARRLELIWAIRHLVVHAAGVADAVFVERHPGVVKAAGDRLVVNSRRFGKFLEAVREFMEPTEKFFLARYPSLAQAYAAPHESTAHIQPTV